MSAQPLKQTIQQRQRREQTTIHNGTRWRMVRTEYSILLLLAVLFAIHRVLCVSPPMSFTTVRPCCCFHRIRPPSQRQIDTRTSGEYSCILVGFVVRQRQTTTTTTIKRMRKQMNEKIIRTTKTVHQKRQASSMKYETFNLKTETYQQTGETAIQNSSCRRVVALKRGLPYVVACTRLGIGTHH